MVWESGCPNPSWGVNVGGRGRRQHLAMEIRGLPGSRWGRCDVRDARVRGVKFCECCCSLYKPWSSKP